MTRQTTVLLAIALTYFIVVNVDGARKILSPSQKPIREALQIGEDEPLDIQVSAGESRQDVVAYKGASYIAVRFENFLLPPGDRVVVRSPDSATVHSYRGTGRTVSGSFYASYIPGDTAIVEYKAQSNTTEESGFGYKIAGFARGRAQYQVNSVCGTGDNSRSAKCFASKFKDPRNQSLATLLPLAYQRSRAVARLLINGTAFCTGWLVGSEGHMITNNHCIKNEWNASVLDIEFGAESDSCKAECQQQMGCPGTIMARHATFITTDEALDVTLLQLSQEVVYQQFGFLQLRGTGPELSESVYLPQYPVGFAKRIASHTDDGSPARIQTTNANKECGANKVGYSADTQGGSSGSPVIAARDNLVVALHHCGGCENSGSDSRDLIAFFEANNVVIPDLVGPNLEPQPPSNASSFSSPGATDAPVSDLPTADPPAPSPEPTVEDPSPAPPPEPSATDQPSPDTSVDAASESSDGSATDDTYDDSELDDASGIDDTATELSSGDSSGDDKFATDYSSESSTNE